MKGFKATSFYYFNRTNTLLKMLFAVDMKIALLL